MRLLNKIRVYSNIYVSLLSALHFTHSLLPCTLYRDGDAGEGQIDAMDNEDHGPTSRGGRGLRCLLAIFEEMIFT